MESKLDQGLLFALLCLGSNLPTALSPHGRYWTYQRPEPPRMTQENARKPNDAPLYQIPMILFRRCGPDPAHFTSVYEPQDSPFRGTGRYQVRISETGFLRR
ncbi:hypothetical protein B0T18DRAFT_120242 [Schizothecium vesticola]|uniref:Uncharacterized protein n=1 Tax=Schizothecium vesticola TaxID=314040 RepID=A0AA40F2H5_9PEZI|nr:hypothetical protein B0T18DRAFT_120242 [Schizothecium vesticola]